MDRDRWGLSKSQRMQLKGLICILGLLLIVLFLFVKLVLLFVHRDEGEIIPPHVPVVETFENVWIMEADEDGILLFRDGEKEEYPLGVIATTADGVEIYFQVASNMREQVADVEITDGGVTKIRLKTQKINGKILGADSEGIVIEGHGKIPLAEDYKGYRLYDSLKMCTVRDLFFGYDYADFCVEEGKICGVLMVKEAAMEYIRVLVKSADFASLLHENLIITCDVNFKVEFGTVENPQNESFAAGTQVQITKDSSYFVGERVRIVPEVLTGKIILQNCARNQGIPAYRGRMELVKTAEGIAVVNEVLLEEYLYSVVPSEMPSNYPAEALKAQAICARTYAYGHMQRAAYPKYGAHVDDSTSYQVYNNVKEQESTTTAVKETYGQLLRTAEGALAGTYYYSTSCGVGSDPTVWKTAEAPTLTYLQAKALNKEAFAQSLAVSGKNQVEMPSETDVALQNGQGTDVGNAMQENLGELLKAEENFAAYIKTVNESDFEATDGWYRWNYVVEEIDYDRMLSVLQKRYKANEKLVLTWNKDEYVSKEIKKLDEIRAIYIEKRGGGGVADELVIETKSKKYKVISEHNIRYVLNNGVSKVLRQNGSQVECASLLPSGFFIIETTTEDKEVTGYTLTGGGFGHGVGMSQNGAKEMAKSGYTADDILLYFYEDCAIRNVYEATEGIE